MESLFSPLADGRVILTASRRSLEGHLGISRGSLWRRIRTLTEAGLGDGRRAVGDRRRGRSASGWFPGLWHSRRGAPASTRLCSRSPSRPRSPPTVPQAFITRTAAPPRCLTSRPSQAPAHVAPPTDTFNVSEPHLTLRTLPRSTSASWSQRRRRSTVLQCWDLPPRGLATPDLATTSFAALDEIAVTLAAQLPDDDGFRRRALSARSKARHDAALRAAKRDTNRDGLAPPGFLTE